MKKFFWAFLFCFSIGISIWIFYNSNVWVGLALGAATILITINKIVKNLLK